MTDHQQPKSRQDKNINKPRRRLLTGLSVSPIIMSLSSRPVLGAQNCAPSGFMSGNLSHPDANGSCGGYSPGYWKTHQNSWPSPFSAGTCETKNNGMPNCSAGVNSDGTKMSEVFSNPKYPDNSLLQVLWEHPGSLEFHVIAALLNSAANIGSYALTTNEVKSSYNSIQQQGYYRTSNGIRMFAPDVRTFIENTYH